MDAPSCHLLCDHFQFTLIHGPNNPVSYAILFFIALDFTSITSHIHNWASFLLLFSLFILSGAISPVFIPIPKKSNAKECSNYLTIPLISHASKVTLKILQARLQQYVNWELQDIQDGFRKGRWTRDQIASIHWIIEKAREFQKSFYFCSIDHVKAFVWITADCGKFLKRWEYQTTLPASWDISMQVKKQQLEKDMEKWTGSKLGKEYIKAVYSYTAYLSYIRVHHVKCWAG